MRNEKQTRRKKKKFLVRSGIFFLVRKLGFFFFFWWGSWDVFLVRKLGCFFLWESWNVFLVRNLGCFLYIFLKNVNYMHLHSVRCLNLSDVVWHPLRLGPPSTSKWIQTSISLRLCTSESNVASANAPKSWKINNS